MPPKKPVSARTISQRSGSDQPRIRRGADGAAVPVPDLLGAADDAVVGRQPVALEYVAPAPARSDLQQRHAAPFSAQLQCRVQARVAAADHRDIDLDVVAQRRQRRLASGEPRAELEQVHQRFAVDRLTTDRRRRRSRHTVRLRNSMRRLNIPPRFDPRDALSAAVAMREGAIACNRGDVAGPASSLPAPPGA